MKLGGWIRYELGLDQSVRFLDGSRINWNLGQEFKFFHDEVLISGLWRRYALNECRFSCHCVSCHSINCALVMFDMNVRPEQWRTA